jgi:hypothetical protein
MDLTDISYEQAIVDLTIANNRVLELSRKINEASTKLGALHAELAKSSDKASTSDKIQNGTSQTGPRTDKQVAKAPLAFPKLFKSKGSKPKILTHIDEIAGAPPSSTGRNTITMGQYRNLTISGWVIPTGKTTSFEFVEVKLSGKNLSTKKKVELLDRPDVAMHFNDPSFAKSGFRAAFSMSELQTGIYALEIEGGRSGAPSESVVVGELEVR